MADTIALDRSKYPDGIGGCPPGTRYWWGDPARRLQPYCIVDDPKPDCPPHWFLRERTSDRSQPVQWYCEKRCPPGTYETAGAAECVRASPARQSIWNALMQSDAIYIFAGCMILGVASVVMVRQLPWLREPLLSGAGAALGAVAMAVAVAPGVSFVRALILGWARSARCSLS